MSPESTIALILAAGFSERMGDFKPLMPLGGVTLLERAVDLFRSVGVRQVRVVVGHRAADLLPVVDRAGARAVVNADYPSGMYSSVKAGMADLDASIAHVFVLPVDIPLVRPATVQAMLDACPLNASAICYPTFAGRRGHPPLIGTRHVPAVLGHCGEGGLAAVLERLQGHAVDVPVIDEFILADADGPEDFRRLARAAGRGDWFTPAECRELLDRLQVPAPVAAHGRAVAAVALRIGAALARAGHALDLPLVCAAALVHDLARGRQHHAQHGGVLLRELGMPRMAHVVERHMDVPAAEPPCIGETEVVYLADKLVQEDRYVGLQRRFERRLAGQAPDSPAASAAGARLEHAVGLAARIEAMIGRPLECLQSEGTDFEVLDRIAF